MFLVGTPAIIPLPALLSVGPLVRGVDRIADAVWVICNAARRPAQRSEAIDEGGALKLAGLSGLNRSGPSA